MAKCEVEFPEDFYKKLAKIPEKSEKIIEKALKEGAEIVLKAAKSNLRRSLGRGKYSKTTGQLLGSIGISPVDINENGVSNIKVGFAEPRLEQPKGGKYGRYEKTNAMVANILEYGARGPGKRKQPKRPFLKPAKNQSRQSAQEAMKAAFEKEIKF
jgi:HK97 gp10 family phage protein